MRTTTPRLVLFADAEPQLREQRRPHIQGVLRPVERIKHSEAAARIIRLEQQLETMRADLQTANRNLEIANNERIQSVRDAAAVSNGRETVLLGLVTLTTRERQILNLVLAGHPSKNIAADLSISQRTVENHRAAIMRKTGSKSVAALVRNALQLG